MPLDARKRLNVRVNGDPAETEARTLAELIASLGYSEGAVATAVNGDFVARGERGKRRLAPGDAVEIVAPRQGG